MIKVTLPDGAVKEYQEGITPFEVAQSISEGLARVVISAEVNNKIVEVTTPIYTDANVTLFTFNEDNGKKAFWHSSAHILAQALEKIYPGIKLTIGPAIENGFYYDVDSGEHTIHEADFKKIEDKFLELAREKADFKLREVSKADALAKYTTEGNEYKVE